ncbi:MAG: hypothetical protein WBN06_13140 [Lysobacterales bacterium]
MKSLNVSFEEKSIWVSLAIITFVFAGYFSQVYEGLMSGTLNKVAVFGLFFGAVFSIIVLEIALHIVIAILNVKDANQPNDERDRLFSMRAGNISGWVLGFGVLIIAAQTFMRELDSLWVANLLLFAVFVSQVLSYALQIFYYRRGY